MKWLSGALALLFSAVMATVAAGQGLPEVKPETVGVSTQRLGQISDFTRRTIAAGKQAGMVTMVARHGQIVHFEASGRYGVDNDKAMTKDTLFRIFSMTKPVKRSRLQPSPSEANRDRTGSIETGTEAEPGRI